MGDVPVQHNARSIPVPVWLREKGENPEAAEEWAADAASLVEGSSSLASESSENPHAPRG